MAVVGDEPKRGRGRPLDGDEARSKQFLVRVTPGEHEAIESAAAGANVSGPAWIRDRVIEALGGETSADVNLAELAELRRRVQVLETWADRMRSKVEDLGDLDRQLEEALAKSKEQRRG